MSSARLDARFLLSDPDAGPVGYVGRNTDGLAELLRQLGRDGGPLEASERSYPVIVARDPTPAELALAASRSASGGALLVETRGPLGSVPGLERQLSRLGFTDTSSYWHWPGFDRCTRIIPLGNPGAVRYALSQVGGTRIERLRARAALLLSRAGTIGWTAGSTTTVARRQAGEGYVPAYLTQAGWRSGPHGRRMGPPDRAFVMLTPRFRSSRRIVVLLLAEDAQRPVLVVKISRRQGRSDAMHREGERMAEAHALRPGGFDSIPRPVATDEFRSRTILVETAMPGRAMDRGMVRRDRVRCCEAALAWLLEVQAASAAPGRGRIEHLLEADLQEIRRSFPEEEDLVGAARDFIRPLYGMDLVTVLEHGDLSHPNLLVDQGGRLSVLDWESAEMAGLPAADLFFALTYVARAVERARSPADVVRAVDRAFAGEAAWTRPYLRRYAEALGIPGSCMAPLFVASWIRQVAGWARRAGDAGADEEPGAGARLRHDWRIDVWRHAVHEGRRGRLRILE